MGMKTWSVNHSDMLGIPKAIRAESKKSASKVAKALKRLENLNFFKAAQNLLQIVVFLISELSEKKIKGDDLLSQCLKVSQRISCYYAPLCERSEMNVA